MTAMNHQIAQMQLNEQTIQLTLANGRQLSTPIKRHIRLEKATPEQRLQWVLTDGDHGLNWPALWEPSNEGMVSVWDIEQDLLYNSAMETLKAADWDVNRLTRPEQELVALWRMEADINNGGFLQFFANWGDANYRTTLAALQQIQATATFGLLQSMYQVIAHLENNDSLKSLHDIPALLSDAEQDQLQALDEAFWDYPERLNKLVVMHYNPLGASKQITLA